MNSNIEQLESNGTDPERCWRSRSQTPQNFEKTDHESSVG